MLIFKVFFHTEHLVFGEELVKLQENISRPELVDLVFFVLMNFKRLKINSKIVQKLHEFLFHVGVLNPSCLLTLETKFYSIGIFPFHLNGHSFEASLHIVDVNQSPTSIIVIFKKLKQIWLSELHLFLDFIEQLSEGVLIFSYIHHIVDEFLVEVNIPLTIRRL